MTPDKVNRWLTLGANIGVLIGIVLLVIELDQNREMIRAQTRNDISQQLASRLLTLASNSQLNNVTRRAAAGEELSADVPNYTNIVPEMQISEIVKSRE